MSFQIQPNSPNSAGAPLSPAANSKLTGDPLPSNPSAFPVNDGSVVTNPTVSAPPLPKVDGIDGIDRGADAAYVVVHHMLTGPKGQFRQGDKISKADLDSPGIDVDRLVKLGAIAPVDAPQVDAAPAEVAPATPKGKGK